MINDFNICNNKIYEKYFFYLIVLLPATVFAKLTDTNDHNVGLVIANVNSENGKYSYAQNESQYFTPASCIKVVTGLFAIKELGPEFVYETTLSKINDEDYVLKFTGDYNLKSHDVHRLLEPLKGKKLKELLIDVSTFMNDEWSHNIIIEDQSNGNMIPMLAAIMDQNSYSFEIQPTKVGELAKVTNHDHQKFIHKIITKENNWVYSERIRGEIFLQGEINVNKKSMIKKVPALNGKRYIHYKIKKILKDLKIEAEHIDFTHNAKDKRLANLTEIAVHKSKPLKELIIPAMKESYNVAFDSYYLTILNKHIHNPKWEDGDRLVKKFLKSEYGIDASDELFGDGSGITRYNRIKPSTLLEILKEGYKNELFKKSLEQAGNEGTLKERKLPSSILAKTGSMSGISCLCGYIEGKEPKVFVSISNNFKPPAFHIRKMEDEYFSNYKE